MTAAVAYISDAMARDAIRLDMYKDVDEELRGKMRYNEVACLSLSFRQLVKISNLQPFVNVQQLQLDNNDIKRIENLDHMVHLTWLDLSFNQIETVEGLEKLTRLQDLSLHHNKLTSIDVLVHNPALATLSVGDNELANLSCVQPLQRLPKLRSLAVHGNPVCLGPMYRPHILVHLPALLFLDDLRILPADIQMARESMQDVVQELQLQNQLTAASDAAVAEAEEAAIMSEKAHTQGMMAVLENAVKDDRDWARLGLIPDLLKAWPEALTKAHAVVADFEVIMIAELAKREAEDAELKYAAGTAVHSQQQEAATQLSLLAKRIKHAVGNAPDAESLEEAKEQLQAATQQLQDAVIGEEVCLAEDLLAMAQKYDHDITVLAEGCQPHYGNFFSNMHDVLDLFWDATIGAAQEAAEKYATDIEGLPEEVVELARDKESLLMLVAACKEAQGAHLDLVREQLYNSHLRAVAAQVTEFKAWTEAMKANRIAELLHVCRGHHDAISKLKIDQ